ncbi:MAG: amidohydrolase [Deltaproteobacteria bacterium]|nr:amidohydrolase [Deltaproteobacteria bacterium]
MTAKEALKRNVQERVDSIKDKIVEIAKYLHQNPEIGYEEYKACELLTSKLEENGFELIRRVAGLPTAFKAVLRGKSERPKVAILAEYDALPGLGHACGHNLSAASAVGAGIALAKLMPEMNGTLLIFGTPAEEGVPDNAGGKVVMLDEFRGLDAAMIMHALDRTTVVCQSFNREALEIEFIGKAANAGNAESSSKGINALEAVMIFWHAVNSFRLLLKDDARVFGIITEGGVSPNIVPDRAVTRLQIRVEDVQYFQEVIEKVKNAAQGAALATGATGNIKKYANTYVNMINNLTLADTFAKNLTALGVPVEKLHRRGAATDMGNVSHVAPAIHPFIAIVPRGTPWHSIESAKASASPQAYETTIKTAKVFGMTAIDIFTDPDLAGKIKEEFAQATAQQ